MREGHVMNASRPTTRVDPANNKVRLTIDIKILNDFAKQLLCLLFKARHGDTYSEDGIVGIGDDEVGDNFSGEILWAVLVNGKERKW